MNPAKTIRQAAKEVNVSHVAFLNWTKRPDWPIAHGPPYSVKELERIAAWRKTLQEDRSTESGDPDLYRAGKQVKILLDRERMQHEKLKREILEGRKIDRELLDASLGGLTSTFISILDDLELTLPSRHASKTQAQIEHEIGPLLDSYRTRLIEKAQYELVAVEKIAQQLAAKVAMRGRGRPAVGSVS